MLAVRCRRRFGPLNEVANPRRYRGPQRPTADRAPCRRRRRAQHPGSHRRSLGHRSCRLVDPRRRGARGGHVHRPQAGRPVARSHDRDQLAGDAERIVGAVIGKSRPLAQFRLIELKTGRTNHSEDRDRPVDGLLAARGGRRQQRAERLRQRRPRASADLHAHRRDRRAVRPRSATAPPRRARPRMARNQPCRSHRTPDRLERDETGCRHCGFPRPAVSHERVVPTSTAAAAIAGSSGSDSLSGRPPPADSRDHQAA